MAKEIFLVRHAQSHRHAGVAHPHWPLSVQGAFQAQALVSLLAPLEIEAVFSSPFLRCLDTLGPFAASRQLPVSIREGLRERLLTPKFLTDEDVQGIWERSWEDFHYALEGCESSHAAQQRIVGELAWISRAGTFRRIAVSSHGNVIGLLLNSLDPSFQRVETERLRNPDVFRLVFDGRLQWDRAFRLAGLDLISTEHAATPVTGHEDAAQAHKSLA
jgi:2,3-bisphosphoglycerate-dependent phosphoglycerate mutase